MENQVVFTILQCGHGCYRLITNHVFFRKMNTACITNIDILYETMHEISKKLNDVYHTAVLFEIG